MSSRQHGRTSSLISSFLFHVHLSIYLASCAWLRDSCKKTRRVCRTNHRNVGIFLSREFYL